MTDHDLLHDELHSLAADLAPDATAARERAHHTVVRRAHRRRAITATAMSGGAIVVAVALVAATIALTRDHDATEHLRPAVTTASVAPSPTSSPSTVAPTTSRPAPTEFEITVPAWSTIPAATADFSRRFPWGTAPDEVSFHTPQGEGASGGPAAFTAAATRDITLLDHSHSRLLTSSNQGDIPIPIAGLTPAVTAAVFDAQGRVIVASVDAVSVYGPDGQPEGSWPHITDDPHGIYELEVDGSTVYWRHGGLYPDQGGAARSALLHDDGSHYVAATDTRAVPDEVYGEINANWTLLHVAATNLEYLILTGDTDVRAARALSDGSFVFVLGHQQHDSGVPAPDDYLVGRIDADGNAHYMTVVAPIGYLVNGPVFDLNDDGIAVMSSTTTAGVTVSYYPYP